MKSICNFKVFCKNLITVFILLLCLSVNFHLIQLFRLSTHLNKQKLNGVGLKHMRMNQVLNLTPEMEG